MNIELLQSLKDLGGIGVLALFIIAMFPVFKSLSKWMEMKINHNIPYDVQNGIQKIETNHLTEIQKSLDRIERSLDKLNTIEIKSHFRSK